MGIVVIAALATAAARELPHHQARGSTPPAATPRTLASPPGTERIDERYEPVPPTLVVLAAGAEPRAALRYRPGLGQRTPFELVVHEHGRPDLQVTGETKVGRFDPDGAILFQNLVETARGDDFDLSGLYVSALVEPTGEIRTIRVESKQPAQRSIVERVAFALASMEQFPEQPVGVGARWQTTVLLPGRPGPVARTRITTLTAKVGSVVELHTTGIESAGAAAVPPTGGPRLQRLEARGDDQRKIALDGLDSTRTVWWMGTQTLAAGGASHTEAIDDRVTLVRRPSPTP